MPKKGARQGLSPPDLEELTLGETSSQCGRCRSVICGEHGATPPSAVGNFGPVPRYFPGNLQKPETRPIFAMAKMSPWESQLLAVGVVRWAPNLHMFRLFLVVGCCKNPRGTSRGLFTLPLVGSKLPPPDTREILETPPDFCDGTVCCCLVFYYSDTRLLAPIGPTQRAHQGGLHLDPLP